MFTDMDLASFLNLIGLLAGGALTSLQIFFLTLLFSLPLGLLVAIGRLSTKKWISNPIKWYISVMRGTPLLLQIWFVYFTPSYIFPGFSLDRFIAAVIAFSLNYAAYFAEIYRGGILSIPRGQYEAAAVLGFTRTQTFVRIILPQVIKRILPPVSNEVITLVKDTALVTVLGISELFRVAKNESSRIFSTTPIFVAGLFYLIMNWAVEKVFHTLERRLGYYR
ncbi:polar amino acid ABC transporter inner membrane subunit [Thermincola ferriacetica]|uniref:Polar amino acid ABC transporter inner membrane subunit n=1 Tax=Thermincola ferriacetica TaxID=281456 RepID=A0A0L6VZ88_9FIRM|nr:amino acid ABC transporter permease [Thermincola ferriacetica]KNZ68642.1 polar amino acid ABC transporter inner membrane subunit [Thermincola ferriacetica]